ncbi:MAG: hypothetical protein KF773_41390 [Deltaproteobacteria bacterium]|nr:hypothetical protein [Deltaproteobacteria bacterium]
MVYPAARTHAQKNEQPIAFVDVPMEPALPGEVPPAPGVPPASSDCGIVTVAVPTHTTAADGPPPPPPP